MTNQETAVHFITLLKEGLISHIEALERISRLVTVAKHDPVFGAMLMIIHDLDNMETKEMMDVYGIGKNQPSAS